ncbi:piggyBac transposable element-derived protein 4-like [Leptopilina boulardi]|uniref:piggyBac transposable element-derived protein 4-like n=1 Tax=Leptopilina boulardi TaxID=63433 RepID=UPI0021F5FA61|nr:piggyBac transposable element-derived protein 4-like [Leptopilina boulardi]
MLTRQRFNAAKLLEVEGNTSKETCSSDDNAEDEMNYSEHDTKSTFSDYSGNSEDSNDNNWVSDNKNAKQKKQPVRKKVGPSKLVNEVKSAEVPSKPISTSGKESVASGGNVTKKSSSKNSNYSKQGISNSKNNAAQTFYLEEILKEIVICTNIRLLYKRNNNNATEKGNNEDTTIPKIRALFGILYMAGVLQMSRTNSQELWSNSDTTAPQFFRLVMSQNRFKVLLSTLRFDNIETREERRALDKLAPIRKIFDDFNKRLPELYIPGECCTIDEMLLAFRGRCPFKQYIPSKLAKYGIKIFSLADAHTFYTIKMEVYLGVQPDGPFYVDNKPSNVVKRLAIPIANSNRNIIFDNWFTSFPLIEELLNDYNLTAVGTVRQNKRELPPTFVQTKSRAVKSTLFGYQQNAVLLSHVPKKNKSVVLVSTVHDTGEIDHSTGEKFLPEIISFYNSTKGGVDVVDKLSAKYNVARDTYRWPLVIFFGILNVAGINSFVIYSLNSAKEIQRRTFLKTLAHELAKPQVLQRSSIRSLQFNLRKEMQRYLGLDQGSVLALEGSNILGSSLGLDESHLLGSVLALEGSNILGSNDKEWLKTLEVNAAGYICGQKMLNAARKAPNEQPAVAEGAINEEPKDDSSLQDAENDAQIPEVNENKVEIIEGSGIFVTLMEEKNLMSLKNNPKKMTTKLVVYLFGKEKLKSMSRTGKRNHEAIPENVLNTVEGKFSYFDIAVKRKG